MTPTPTPVEAGWVRVSSIVLTGSDYEVVESANVSLNLNADGGYSDTANVSLNGNRDVNALLLEFGVDSVIFDGTTHTTSVEPLDKSNHKVWVAHLSTAFEQLNVESSIATESYDFTTCILTISASDT